MMGTSGDQEVRDNLEEGIGQEGRIENRIDQEIVERIVQEERVKKAKGGNKVGGRMINLDPVKCVSISN